ncbi:Two component regulator propeller [Planctomycetes bacterium Poly30]|uniref:Two component regulator propeller n=1 Tax=Saltatorellus ferox TaxID=2528018 RepID=A0A518EM37_9BACT|nr:Two component regulator propeller [Planctomycetes bacterium Poly30]
MTRSTLLCPPIRQLAAFACLFVGCSGVRPDTGPETSAVAPRLTPKVYSRSDCVRSGLLHSDGSLWFPTNHEGVFRYAEGEFTQFTESDGLPGSYVSTVVEDQAGHLWFGMERGLCHYDGTRFTPVSIPWDGNEDLWGEGLNAHLVLCLHCDTRGQIWLGTWGNGVHRFDPSQPVGPGEYAFVSYLQERGAIYPDGDHRNAIQSISEDRDQNVWLTSMSHGGVSRFDGREFTHYQKESGLSDDMVFSSLFDRDGTLWLGMLGNLPGGLNRFDGDSFMHYGEEDGLSSDNIICLFEDRQGVLWLGSDRGELCLLNRDSEGEVTIAPFQFEGRTFEHIHFVVEDAAGGVWFGGRFGQLFRYDGATLVDHSSKR